MEAQSTIPFPKEPQRWDASRMLIYFDERQEEKEGVMIYCASITLMPNGGDAEKAIEWARNNPEENEKLFR